MEFKSIRIIGLLGLGIGIALIVLTFFILTPAFLATRFDFIGTLTASKIQEIQFDRYLVAALAAIVAVISTLYLVRPSIVRGFFNIASSLKERLQQKSYYLLFCLGCFLIALAFGFWGTMSGPGLSADSITYTSVAESLYRGEGFNDFIRGGPFTRGAPLYPMTIAALMHLGLDAFQAARLIPILSFALMIVLLFFLIKRASGIFNGYIVCLITLVFMQLLFLTVMAWTEMFYVLFSVLAILFITRYVQDDKSKILMLCLAGLFTALALLTRYIGITVAVAGLIALLVSNRFDIRKFVVHGLIYGLIAGLPILPWLIRNITLTSRLQGFDAEASGVGLLQNIKLMVTTLLGGYSLGEIAHFYPYAYPILAILIIIIGLIIYYVRRNAAAPGVWSVFLEKNYTIISYALIYITAIVVIRSILFHGVEHRDVAPVYPFLTAAIISFIFYAFTRIEKTWLKPILFNILAVFCAILIILQAGTSLYFLNNASHGLGLNAPFWRESQSLAWAKSNIPDGAVIYSNAGRAINYRLKKPSLNLPISGSQEETDEFILALEEGSVFIIVFQEEPEIPEIGKVRLSNDEITEINCEYDVLVIAAEFPEATIWRTRR